MSKVRLSHIIDEDIAGKFTIALNLSGEDADAVIEELMRGYIVRTFSETANFYTPLAESTKEEGMYHGKANQRIPAWAQKPNQYNHKIIRAFFAASNGGTTALLSEMEKLCSDSSVPELYVPTFRNNYAQMKIDGPKSHGRVFEDDGHMVTIWPDVQATLMKYRSFFES
ncbi:MAG: hypothetical protein IJ418_07045 [Clostridia bacterium]|nr:hypothetical protein [Clostridia bacterium]